MTRSLRHLRASDLRAATQLITQATLGATDIAEGIHRSVHRTLGMPVGQSPTRTRGITGLVYRSVRATTRSVGQGLDRLLALVLPKAAPAEEAPASTPQREAVIAALNGVLGDRLQASGSPLATRMSLRHQGQHLDPQDPVGLPAGRGKVLLMIHGLCMNDLQWRAIGSGQRVDHWAALADNLGHAPIYLRYNSGLNISHNGQQLAAQLEQLLSRRPEALEEISVIAHSMGGLLIRSAVACGRAAGMQWPDRLRHIVFLGTPHHGAPLEQAGNWIDVLLGATPYSAPLARLGHLRSAGITDLRYGHVLEADWQGQDRFARQPDRRRHLPLPAGVACHAVAATTADQVGSLEDRLLGDGLVPLASALGQHRNPARDLGFAEADRWIACRTNHMQLLSRPEVARQLLRWLAPSAKPAPAGP